MQNIKNTLQKISDFLSSKNEINNIEKDLLLGYTRDLYEEILSANASQKQAIVLEKHEEEHSAKVTIEEEKTDVTSSKEIGDDNDEINEDFEEEIEDIDDVIAEESEEENKEEEKIIFDLENVENKPFLLEPELNNAEDKTKIEFTKPSPIESFIKNEFPVQKTQDTEFKLWNKDIKKYIGINDKYNFISELFGNNAEAYDELLNEINLCETKEAAIKLLSDSGASTLYNWKEEGESEMVFYNVLNQFFASR